MDQTTVDSRPPHPLSNGFSADGSTPPLPATPGSYIDHRQSNLLLNAQYSGYPYQSTYSNLLASALGPGYDSLEEGMKVRTKPSFANNSER
jgi:hypothetical protein